MRVTIPDASQGAAFGSFAINNRLTFPKDGGNINPLIINDYLKQRNTEKSSLKSSK